MKNVVEKIKVSTRQKSMVGIIPVAGEKLDFNMPWHDSMLQIGHNFTAIEKCVAECALVGCNTIWIVSRSHYTNLLRNRLGEYIYDPQRISDSKIHKNRDLLARIPIFYISAHVKDVDRRDCLGWSAIYGAMRCFDLFRKMSKFSVPDRYYFTFPYGMYDYSILRNYRTTAYNKEDKRFFLSYQGKSVLDGLYLPFSCEPWGIVELNRHFRKTSTGKYYPGSKTKLLPPEERYRERFFPLDESLGGITFSETDHQVEIDDYHHVDSWEGYMGYMKSDMLLERPDYLVKREFSPIAINYKVPEKKQKVKVHPTIRKVLQEDFDAGMTYPKLSEKYGLAPHQVGRIVRDEKQD